jgi:hypothetical protein
MEGVTERDRDGREAARKGTGANGVLEFTGLRVGPGLSDSTDILPARERPRLGLSNREDRKQVGYLSVQPLLHFCAF